MRTLLVLVTSIISIPAWAGALDDAKTLGAPIGIARIMPPGWFKEVHVKAIDSHSVRALLASRALLVKIKRDLENHVRGLLKDLGLVIGRVPSSMSSPCEPRS